MGIFDKLFGKKPEPVKVEAPKKEKKPRKPKVEISAKDRATQAGEPYVAILSVNVDPNNIHEGAFELDWNDIFIARLVKAGYMKKKEDTPNEIIDRWFSDVCRNVVLEMYDQQIADPDNRERGDVRVVRSKDLGNGRTEVS